MSNYVKRLEVVGLHGRLDLDIEFFQDVNIVYGRNGSGKTTLLHILANLLNGSLERFAFLDFAEIALTTYEDRTIRLLQRSADRHNTLITVQVDNATIGEIPTRLWRNRLEHSPEAAPIPEPRIDLLPRPDLLPVSNPSYFPAFRSMIEAWSSVDLDESPRLRGRVPGSV